MSYVYSEKKKIFCPDTGEQCNGTNYLYSKHWKQMRLKVYEHFKGECQRCKTVLPLEQAVIHHRVYKNIGNEHMNDLILYCNSCHQKVHKNKKKSHNTNKSIQFYIKLLNDEEKMKVINYIKKYIICY